MNSKNFIARKIISLTLACSALSMCLYGCGDSKSGTHAGTTYSESKLENGTDLRTALGVPESIKETWKSNSGLTVAEVNAAIEFPDVSAVPVFEVKTRSFTDDEVDAFVETAFDGTAYFHENRDEKPSKDKSSKNQSSKFGWYRSEEEYYSKYYDMNLPISDASVEPSGSPGATARYSIKRIEENVEFISRASCARLGGSPLQENGWAAGTTLSPEDALSKAESIVHTFAPDLECVGKGAVTATTITDSIESDADILDKQAYVFNFTRPYAGISTTYTNDECTENDGNPEQYAPSCYYECAVIVISEYGLESITWKQPHETVGKINENVQLLSFNEIKNIASSMLPLKYSYYEQNGELTNIKINRVTFGYTRVLMKDEPTRYMMVPVWDFFGDFDVNCGVDGEPTLYNSMLTLNAIDGTVIDREYGY